MHIIKRIHKEKATCVISWILGLETVVSASPSPHANLYVSINLLYNPLSLLKQMLMAWVHLMFLFIRKQLITAMHIAIQPFMHLTYIYFAFNIDANIVNM